MIYLQYLPTYTPTWLPIPTFLFIHLSIYLAIHLSPIHLFIYLSTYLSTYLQFSTGAQETREPPFAPLRSRIAQSDLPAFEFLVGLRAFSERELRGDSFIDISHVERCLQVAREMAKSELSSLVDFQNLLAATYVDWNPAYIDIRRSLDLNCNLASLTQFTETHDLDFHSELCFLDFGDFLNFQPRLLEP